ncbi:MAG: hypothetical protein WBB39_03355 [Candidatus Saccharimonadales bacterium]
MHGEYIVDRLLPRIARGICTAHGIEFSAFSDDWVLRLRKGDVTKWIIGYTFDINTSGSAGVANDKVATYEALYAASVPAVEHYLAITRTSPHLLESNIAKIPSTSQVIAKPVSGGGGRYVTMLPTIEAARKFLLDTADDEWSVSPYYDVVCETRVILLDQTLLCCYQKSNPTIHDNLKMFNLGHGATATFMEPITKLLDLAKRAQQACNLRLCAVDIVTLNSGEDRVLEINTGFAMEHFARQSKEYYQKTFDVYETIITMMMD